MSRMRNMLTSIWGGSSRTSFYSLSNLGYFAMIAFLISNSSKRNSFKFDDEDRKIIKEINERCEKLLAEDAKPDVPTTQFKSDSDAQQINNIVPALSMK